MCYIESFYIKSKKKRKKKEKSNKFTVPCKTSKTVSFASTIIIAPSSRFRFLVRLICYIDFGSTSNACCLIKSIAIIL